ncbi:TonB-dependent receptor [Massilia sp. Leaf139]|nr:TonB-dependent receptor [Massilia sp. Leaf139]
MGVASPAVAQQLQPNTPMARVEVTGSSIKRIAKEGALPVQVINYEQIEKQGITTTEELVRTISANGTGADNMTSGNNVFGADADRVSGGASFASLRGLGPNSTLVLLNGRRIATHGGSGKAVDLNSIPLSAIARVEILKDGASAIYGTDAVGGVVNFILRTNYQGVEASANINATEEGGGTTHRATLLAGHGDLEADRFNVMASVTVDKTDMLHSHQRKFANGFQPSRGLSPDTTGTPYANQLTGAGTALGANFTVPGDATRYLQANLLSFQNKCDSIPYMSQYQSQLWADVTPVTRTRFSCAYDYGADYVMMPPAERANAIARGSFQIAPNHRLFVEGMASHSKVTSILTPMQISTSLATGSAYPVGGAYYQDLSQYVSTFDRTKPIIYKWRATDFGNREMDNTTESARLLVGLEGTLDRWDYKLGLARAMSKTQTTLTDGYAFTTPMYQALGTGKINPWLAPGQTQTAEALALIESTKFRGDLQHGRTTLTQLDGSISGEVFNLPAGAVAAAVGFDLRREGYEYGQDADATIVWQAPGNAALKEATRDIKAVYAELIVPVFKDLEVQLAVRRDDYSVIGATTNPKIAFRYQPTNWLLFRGSANKGFLAPSFTQLYSASLDGELPNGVIDPIGCPANPGNPEYCAIARLDFKAGGNSSLRPETSKQGTLGMVIEPFKGFSASLDYWMINTQDKILNRTPQIILANQPALAENVIRNAPNASGIGTIDYVRSGWINAGGAKTRGADLGLRGDGRVSDVKWSAALDGTWTQSFKFAELAGQEYKEYVGKFYTRDLYLRWKHSATLTVSRGDWSGMLSQFFASGYKDQVPNKGIGAPPAGFDPDVSSYTRFGLSATYTGFKNTSLTFGIQNLFDRDPPFTAHNVDEVVGAGWDPRVADPRGRSFSLTLKHKFF